MIRDSRSPGCRIQLHLHYTVDNARQRKGVGVMTEVSRLIAIHSISSHCHGFSLQANSAACVSLVVDDVSFYECDRKTNENVERARLT